jgi:peptidyl-prolyl cis-trans isomerase SurA
MFLFPSYQSGNLTIYPFTRRAILAMHSHEVPYLKSLYTAGLCALAVFLSSCSPKSSEAIVATVGEKPITLQEYEKLYLKSNGGTREQAAASSEEEREKFLELMTKFRLKLADAYRRGLDKSPEVLKEIEHYRGSLAASYLTERNVTAPGVRRLYDRRNEEIRASHILLSLKPDAPDSEVQATTKRANEIIAAAKAGADFSLLALEHSQDPSVKTNKGDLYYFSAGRMVPAFEDGVYALKVGEISPTPIRTPYGLHIVKIVDRKPSPGEMHSAHIMIRFDKQEPTPEDTLKAYEKIKAIQDSLATGMDFAELAQRNSEDPGSAPRGGDLGWFTRGRWPRPFDDTCFTMKPGQVSNVVRTIYGYHLIKCLETRPLKSFEESKKELQSQYQQQRFQDDYQAFLANVKKQTGFALRESVVERFVATLDSTKAPRDTTWMDAVPAALRDSVIIMFGRRPFSVDTVAAIIASRPDLNTTPLRPSTVRRDIDKVAEQLTFAVRGESLEREDPEFAQLMKEYVDGILLYQVEQEEIWNRVAVSDSAVHSYFETHRDQFTYPDRVNLTEIRAANDSLARIISAQVQNGRSFEEIAASDSVRMHAPLSITITFPRRSTQISRQDGRDLGTLCAETKSDPAVKVRLAAQSDTSDAKMVKLVGNRIKAVKSYLVKTLRIPEERILTASTPIAKAPANITKAEKDGFGAIVHVSLVGRMPIVQGRLTTELLPVSQDDRTKKADSLTIGTSSAPFAFKGAHLLVRLNEREAARQKSFEEAGTEVSSAFQEYESKRLESAWIEHLRTLYPVVEYKEALQSAFVSKP